MELTPTMIEQLKKDLGDNPTVEKLLGKGGAIKNLLKSLLETMYEAEMTDHLGYDKHSPVGNNSGNSRNGTSPKTLKSEFGQLKVEVPRDRNGEYKPVLIKKYKKDIGLIEEKIISMYARGMTTRDIQSHVQEIYELDISPSMISKITDKVLDKVKQWQGRQLEKVYPIAFFDAIHFKVNSEGRVISKAAYTCLAIDVDGRKDLLGIWIGESEAAHFWLGIFDELKARGVNDILISCVDGLIGFPEAINTVFPKAEIQLCIIHAIRNILKRVGSRDRRLFMADLKYVYKADTLENAELALDKLEEKWGKKYSSAIKIWRSQWGNLSNYFAYPEELRKVIYTTNAVEALHRQFRKVTKAKSLFPTDDSLRKILFLSYKNISERWNVSICKWQVIMNHLNIIFKDRLDVYF
jgi:transposase-like protein